MDTCASWQSASLSSAEKLRCSSSVGSRSNSSGPLLSTACVTTERYDKLGGAIEAISSSGIGLR